MNSKFLYAATIAVSLISTVAMADEAPVSRAQVNAETQQAIANGTLRRTDYDVGSYRPQAVTSNVTREQVAFELAQAKTARKALIGPDANRTYNQFGTQILENIDAGAQRSEERSAASASRRDAATHRLRRRGLAHPQGQPARRFGDVCPTRQGEVLEEPGLSAARA